MDAQHQLGPPEADLGISRPRAWAVWAKSHSPRPSEFTSPIRYVGNLQLVQRLRRESYTMLATGRARNLIEVARKIDRKGIPGAVVDCGVWNGGSAILMAMELPDREVWAFDSFEGMPKPGHRDAGVHPGWEGMVRGSEEKLKEGFARYAGETGRLHVVKGWFEDTLEQAVANIDQIAILHVDADWYESVKLALEAFYDLVAPGGAVAIDDFSTWRGARDATIEFRRSRRVRGRLRGRHYWYKR